MSGMEGRTLLKLAGIMKSDGSVVSLPSDGSLAAIIAYDGSKAAIGLRTVRQVSCRRNRGQHDSLPDLGPAAAKLPHRLERLHSDSQI